MPLRFGDFTLRPESYGLERDCETIHLEPRVFELLVYLVEHRDRVVSKHELLERLWKRRFVSESALSGSIRDLRRALGESGSNPSRIQTVHGRGYRFLGAVESAPDPLLVTARPASRDPSLVVLPLDDVSAAPAPEYFGEGMTDALITELARFRSLRVISRTTALSFKGSRKSAREIGVELGVDYAVEGTILRQGDGVRITARLVRVAPEQLLWAERYERELRDVLALQVDVARAVAQEIDARLAAEPRRATPPRQIDPEVFLLDLEGRHLLARRTEEGFRRARSCFARAIDLDRSFAPAHAGLAESLAMLANYGIEAPVEVRAPARAAARRALELDPDSADAHRTLALLGWQFDFDWQGADDQYRRALELAPSSSSVHYWRGTFLGVQGRFAESRVEHEKALSLDPLALNVVAVMGWMFYFEGRHAEAIPYYRRVLEVDPGHFLGRWFLGEALIELGRWDEGLAELEAVTARAQRGARFLGYLGYALGRAGRRREAEALAGELEERRRGRYVPRYFSALVRIGLEDRCGALDALELAASERDSMLRDLLVDPPWRPLRGAPRYRDLLARLRLSPPL